MTIQFGFQCIGAHALEFADTRELNHFGLARPLLWLLIDGRAQVAPVGRRRLRFLSFFPFLSSWSSSAAAAEDSHHHQRHRRNEAATQHKPREGDRPATAHTKQIFYEKIVCVFHSHKERRQQT